MSAPSGSRRFADKNALVNKMDQVTDKAWEIKKRAREADDEIEKKVEVVLNNLKLKGERVEAVKLAYRKAAKLLEEKDLRIEAARGVEFRNAIEGRMIALDSEWMPNRHKRPAEMVEELGKKIEKKARIEIENGEKTLRQSASNFESAATKWEGESKRLQHIIELQGTFITRLKATINLE